MRSRASVVTPGATWRPNSARACAAILELIRMSSTTSSLCTSPPCHAAACFLPTYSGRETLAGTGRIGETEPLTMPSRAGAILGSLRAEEVGYARGRRHDGVLLQHANPHGREGAPQFLGAPARPI